MSPFSSSLPHGSLTGAPGPRTLVVSGGKSGLGATTLAVQLAAALAHDALRVVLVDGNLQNPQIAERCGIRPLLTIGDVIAGKKNIHEALQLGPAGLQILCGKLESGQIQSAKSVQRLLKQMRALAPHTDWLVIDAGSRATDITSLLWAAADQLLMVTSPDPAAVMDTYALIKTLLSRHPLPHPPALIVNQAADDATAADVHRRIDQSCRRFLGLAIGFAGWLPMDPTTRLAVIAAGALAPAVIDLAHRLCEQSHHGHERSALPHHVAA
jgi:flagellar biosynthesis protein FlhG